MSLRYNAAPPFEQLRPELMKGYYKAVHDFWLTFITDPQIALQEEFPKVVTAIQSAEADTFEPVDMFCQFEDISRMVSSTEPFRRVPRLQFDPIEYFGETAVAAIVDKGYELLAAGDA